MMDATAAQSFKNRFPKFHFSQVSKKRVSSTYEKNGTYMAIPRGKKYYAWFTFYKTYNVCVFMNSSMGDLFYEKVDYSPLSLGTVLYGTLVDYKTHFVCENIFFYEGRAVRSAQFDDKLDMFLRMAERRDSTAMPKKTSISIAPMWSGNVPTSFYNPATTYCVYELTQNPSETKTPLPVVQATQQKPVHVHAATSEKKLAPKPAVTPAQHQTRIFFVKADIMNDIYHLYVKTDKEAPNETNLKYHSIAFIPDYKTSVFMNKIFRKIRENDNLDYIEESDDEDFEDTSYDKYVYLDKIERMTCTYNYKFKKWAPILQKCTRVAK